MYLGGVGLARGYLQRPGLSAERFVANPFSRTGERLYRTGDLVRQREDGTFDYLGRIDNQVKVRGFRIELGEIEARLQDAGEVREAVVVARDAASGKQLLGYVVAEDGVDASGLLERLRERLKRDLPEYMVPAHLALLPAMPLTPNGKIDRKALPDIDVTASEAYVAPRNELELALAGIWQEVLGIARIGVHDNFFELGGDSILSMQVVAKARALKKLGFSLKLRDLIQKPSIAALSGYDDSAAPPSPILALNAAVDGCPPLFCVHAGFGTVFDYEPLARRLNGRRSVLAIQARSLLDPNWRDVSLQRMAEDYVALIRQRQAEGPYHLLGWSLGGTLGMLMAAELERQGQQVAFLGLLDSYVPGTEAPAADDWREDLLDFLSVSAGLKPVRHWPPGWSNATTSAPPSPSALASARPGREGWAATNWPRYSWSPGNSSNSPGNWIVARRSRSGRCAGGRAGVVKRCGRCRGWVVSLWPVGSPRAGISRYPMRRRCSTPGGGA